MCHKTPGNGSRRVQEGLQSVQEGFGGHLKGHLRYFDLFGKHEPICGYFLGSEASKTLKMAKVDLGMAIKIPFGPFPAIPRPLHD